jgi:glycosyltransferase involved in cell wall biosynthesis
VAAVWSVARIARAARADVIYTYDRTRAAEAAFLAARLLRKKLLFHAHYPLYLDKRRVRRFVAFHSDRLIAISRFVAGHYLRAGCPPEKLSLVLNGAEPLPDTPFEPGALRRRMGISPEAPVLGMVGRLSPFKGHEELLRAVAIARRSVPDLRVIIAGRDTDESMWTHGRPSFRAILEELRAELGLQDVVQFLGFSASATEVYAAADVAVAPSHEEPFGLVVIEAMLAGKPVISTNAGGVPEIVTDGATGVLVPPKEPEALARAIVALLEDRETADRLASAGQRHARERFSLARYSAEFQTVLEGVS